MTFPKISLEVIEATFAVAQRKDMSEYALSSVMDLMQSQPELTNLISGMCANMISGGDDVESVPADFAQNAILVAAYASYGLAMNAIKAQIETDELNKEWA